MKLVSRFFRKSYFMTIVDEFRTRYMCSICKNEIERCKKF